MSETKEEIKNLVNQIIKEEDTMNFFSKHSNYQNAINNYSKNQNTINSLKMKAERNSFASENNINKLKNDIKELEINLSSLKDPHCKYTKKDIEQNLIKLKIISNTIKLFKEEFDSIKENLLLLDEEYNICSLNLVYFISIKDSYEEIIKINSKNIFKNLIISYDQNIGESISSKISEKEVIKDNIFNSYNKENNLIIESYDIYNITLLQKFSNFIYKIFSTYITSLEQENNIKSLIFSIIEEKYYDFINGKSKLENFVNELAYNITTSNDKVNNFVSLPRFEILLKYIIKIFSLEKTINKTIKFINEDYPYNLEFFKIKYEDIKKKIQVSTREKIECQMQHKEMELEYKKLISYQNEIEKIKKEIQIKEEEITNEVNKYLIINKKYENKIKKLENINNVLNMKYDGINTKNVLENIKNKINDLYDEINNKIKLTNSTNKNDLIISLYTKINKTIENNNEDDDQVNITSLDNININKKEEELILSNPKFNINTTIDCYIRFSNKINEYDFDPINDYDIKPELKGYIKSLINLSGKVIKIKQNQNNCYNIEIKEIINIKIHENMGKINYIIRKYKKLNTNNNNIENILKDIKLNEEMKMDTKDIIKCIYNKYYCLSVILCTEKRINIIFLSYEPFKAWLKILDDIIEKNLKK